MDPVKNPYQPGAGCRPPELVGRNSIIEEARILIGRVAEGRNEKSMLLTGLRGVGKTVLLNEMVSLAEKNKYLTSNLKLSAAFESIKTISWPF